jgi:RNA polymerase sigma-70 factor (ECF subfamily)
MDRPAPHPATPSGSERLRRLLEEHGSWIRRTVERRCPRHLGIDPAEIEQDVILRVWRALERESELRAPASFLYRVIATALVDAVRRRRARPEEQLVLESEEHPSGRREPRASGPSPELAARHAEVLREVDRALGTMQPRRRLAVRLHLQGFDTTEIGRLAGWTEPKARNLVYRGLDELRRRLLERGIEYERGT